MEKFTEGERRQLIQALSIRPGYLVMMFNKAADRDGNCTRDVDNSWCAQY
jgi:hypothetical protein